VSANVQQPEPAATFTSSVSDTSQSAASTPATAASLPLLQSVVRVSAPLVAIHSLAGASSGAGSAMSPSTTGAEKINSESVQETEGTYVASVPNSSGATASGSSVQSAESNLNVVLDRLA